jgi:hypothetical protein
MQQSKANLARTASVIAVDEDFSKSRRPRRMSSHSSLSFSMSAATLEAAAVSVFGASSERLVPTTTQPKATEELLGLSCTIGTYGEVWTICL